MLSPAVSDNSIIEKKDATCQIKELDALLFRFTYLTKMGMMKARYVLEAVAECAVAEYVKQPKQADEQNCLIAGKDICNY